MYQCQFGQSLAIASEDRTQCFHGYMTLVTLKIRSRSPKSDHFKDPPNGVSMSVWSKPGHEFRRNGAAKALTYTYMTKLTLKIKSRSPKSDHFLVLPLIHVSIPVWSKCGHYFSSKRVQTMLYIALYVNLHGILEN